MSTTTMALPEETKRRGSWVPTRRKPECPLGISIDKHFEAKIYTSGSTVAGTVSFMPQTNLTFDTCEITFTGAASSLVQIFHQGTMPKSGHQFLLLRMPIAETALPASGKLQARQTYEVPFAFVIPYQLPSAAYKHRNTEHDDMAVHTVGIQYAVEARALLKADKRGKSPTLERCHPVRVMPFLPEQPPLHIVPGSARFMLSQEKSIRKDILSSKLGYIRASARQPKPVIISANKLHPSNCQLSINLKFWPTSKKAAPPEICGKSAAIKASTYYSTGHISFSPDQHNNPSVTPNPILSFVLDENAIINQAPMLSSHRGSEMPKMDQEPPRTSSRRGFKSSDIIKTESPRHTATLPISITLPSPENKILLPTFYSCLISRTYILEVVLAARSHGSSFTLRLPLQVAVDGNNETDRNSIPAYEQVQAGQGCYDMLPSYEIAM
ncbi:hypothetical protein DER44DRAFT_815571 [Fusarium oxysporum]|nr:hypothetical protein DER44DRAFT_815571 [Fusarium oxysporum]